MRRLLLTLSVLCLLLAACAPSTGGDESAAPGEDPAATAEEETGGGATEAGSDSDLSGDLTVWSWRTEDVAGYEKIFETFTERHPGVTIDFVAHVNTEYNTILSTGLTEEGGPDVMQLRAYGGLQPFVESGNLLPLDDEVDVSGFSDDVLEGARGTDGTLYGVPFAIQTMQVFYNQAIFDEHGLEEPETWDDFIAINQTLADAGVTPMATTGADAWMLPIVHDTVAATRYGGGEFADALLAGDTDFTDPDYVASIELVEQLSEFFPPDVVGVAYTDAQVLFTTGQAAMFPGGSFETAFFREQAPDLEMGVFSVPPPPDAVTDTVLTPGWMDGSWGVNASSPDQEAALELVRWMATEEYGQLFADELGQLSAVPGVTPQDPLLAEMAEGYEQNPAPYLHLMHFRYGEPTGDSILGEGIQQMLLGDADAAQVAENVQTGVSQWFEPDSG